MRSHFYRRLKILWSIRTHFTSPGHGQVKVNLFQRSRVTRWLHYLVSFWPITATKICPIAFKFTQITSKFCQILNEPFQNGQSFLTVCQSGEISPNLVTLQWRKGHQMLNCLSAINFVKLNKIYRQYKVARNNIKNKQRL